MRVQSVEKLEKQARRYSDTHPVKMSQEWETEYNSASKKLSRIGKFMRKIQEDFCGARWGNGVKCTCAEHPDYNSIQSRLTPLETKLHNLVYERYKLQELVYKKELSELMKMRKAKLEYLGSINSTTNNA